ncbi:acyl-CoA dehydrogenase family protein [Streptomyces sp. NRRL B-1347]|uniref:acyl-CoA dehydrogenase family protein n=1 Tax=Streptomyces sp. NRRL B-1347 TaxID=1476877 RepID=UPI0004C5173E|nr:acyl-CoA dehydrogenase family protein [Streptomyces sp. NRRL B-1347]
MIEHIVREVADECDDCLLDFLTEKINPGASQRDVDGTPIATELIREAITRGLFQYALPTDLRGRGFDPLRWGLTVEHLGYRCTDLSFPLLTYLAAATAVHVFDSGRSELIEEYAEPAARGDLFLGFAYTEEQDPFSAHSTISRRGDFATVNLSKSIVAGALLFDAFITYAVDETGALVAFVLDKRDPGVSIEPIDVAGFRAAGFGRIQARDMVVPAARIIDLDGLAHAQRIINGQVSFFAAGPTGRLRSILHDCAQRLSSTERHGTPLGEFLNVQSMLGHMYVDVETCRSALYRAWLTIDPVGGLWAPLAWVAKFTVGEYGIRLITKAQQLSGTTGFLRETAYERHLRDLSGLLAGGNPQDKVLIDLGAAHFTPQSPARQRGRGTQ